MATRKPRRSGLFTQVSKQFTTDMIQAGVSLAGAGLYTAVMTDPGTSALGYVYRKHEWTMFAESNGDTVDKLLNELERASLIVVDGAHIVIRDYMRKYAFDLPSYLRSGLYDLDRQILTSSLLRFVIGAEMLRLDLRGMAGTKPVNVREAANPIWREITGGELPPVHHLMGGDIPSTMLDTLATMPGATDVLQAVDERKWTVVADHLVEPLQQAFTAHHGSGSVTPLVRRRTGSS
jgi:hypothetical protein